METNEIMYKCPKCDRLMSKAAYLLTICTSACPNCNCDMPTVYYEEFKINKGDEIEAKKDDIELSIYIKDQIAIVLKEVMGEEFERSYRDGYSRGYEEGEEAGYITGYSDAETDDSTEEYIKGFNSGYEMRKFFCTRGDTNGRNNNKYNGK